MKQLFDRIRKINLRKLTKKDLPILAGCIVALVGVIVIFILLLQPNRTAANFCQVAKEQKSILVGDVNYEKRVEAYKKLEAVSPDEIRPDIAVIRKGYETIVQNPSNALGAGFGIMGSESRRSTYIKMNCSDF